MTKNKQKVIVIGLDGATFTNLRPWMEEGLLPNMKFLIENGASGDLESTVPNESGPAWTSFMTGVNPGKHGIYGFATPFKDKKYELGLANSKKFGVKTIFEILSEQDKTSIAINIPLTYPPFPIKGSLVSCGLTTPSKEFTFTYPGDLFEKVGFKRNDYQLNIISSSYKESEQEKFFSDLLRCAEVRKNLAFRLMDTSDWDLFTIVFTGPDRIQHHYWHLIDSSHPRYDESRAKKILPLIKQHYQKLDTFIGEFKQRMDKSTTLILMSDHGFGPLEKMVGFHNVLSNAGLLHYKNEFFKIAKRQTGGGLRGYLQNNSPLYRHIKSIIKKFFKKRKISEKKFKEKRFSSSNYLAMIDWQKTSAYQAIAENAIHFNIKGREPEGIIDSPDDYKKTRDAIIQIVKNIYDPDLKRNLKVEVFERDFLYSGPYKVEAPDLFFKIENERYTLRGTLPPGVVLKSTKQSGSHRSNGIFIGYGSNVKRDVKIHGGRIIDMTPTILYILGFDLHTYMDGCVLSAAIAERIYKEKHLTSDVDPYRVSKNESIYSEEDKEKVKKHLADLGYL